MRTSARTTRAVLVCGLAFGALATTLPLSGCGSGSKGASSGSAAASRKRGSVSLNVIWPELTRVVPLASNSIRITLTRTPDAEIPSPAPVTPVVLVRPATSTTINNLELGNYTVVAEAFPTNNATGNVQARATTTITVVAGNNPLLNLTMNATVATVELNALPPFNNALSFPKRRGDVIDLIATAKDAAGNVVLTTAGANSSLVFSVTAETPAAGETDVVTVDANGKVTVVGLGSATIRARYEEPGITPGQQGTGAAASININAVPTGVSTDPWPKFHGDAQNTGQATRGASVRTATFAPGAWPFQTFSSIVFSSPTVTEPDGTGRSTVYVGAQNGNLYAVNSDGSLKWTFKTNGPIESAPTLTKNGTIIVTSMDGMVYALRDGGAQADTVWTFDAGGPVFASPALSSDGILYFGTVTNGATQKATFFAVDSLTGRELWFYTDPNLPGGQDDGIQTTAVLSPDERTVYFGTLDGYVYALWTGRAGDPQPTPTPPGAPRAGLVAQRRWRSAEFGDLFSSSPVLGNTTTNGLTLYIGSTDGKVYGLNANSGGTIWEYDAGAPVYSTVALRAGGAVLYIATLDNVSGTNDSKVAALRADTGAEIWRTAAGIFSDGFTSSPAISAAGDVLYLGNFNGRIYGIDATVDLTTNPASPLPTATSGQIVWQLATPPPPVGQPDNNIESSPAVSADGTVYLGGFSGEIYAIK